MCRQPGKSRLGRDCTLMPAPPQLQPSRPPSPLASTPRAMRTESARTEPKKGGRSGCFGARTPRCCLPQLSWLHCSCWPAVCPPPAVAGPGAGVADCRTPLCDPLPLQKALQWWAVVGKARLLCRRVQALPAAQPRHMRPSTTQIAPTCAVGWHPCTADGWAGM